MENIEQRVRKIVAEQLDRRLRPHSRNQLIDSLLDGLTD